jgi:hypothetical protein
MATFGNAVMRAACEAMAIKQLAAAAAIYQQQEIERAAEEDGYGYVFSCDAEMMAFREEAAYQRSRAGA